MNSKLIELARSAGIRGDNWNAFTASDAVQALVSVDTEFDTAVIEAAYTEGLAEHRIASGWKSFWTTAPADYDGFGTMSLESTGEWRGKVLRRVLVDPDCIAWQTSRYASGLCGSWEENPCIAETRARERLACDRAMAAEHDARRQAGLVWLAALSEEVLSDIDFEDFEPRGLRYQDVRQARENRAAEKAKRELAELWTRCLAIVPEGSVLVDHGEPSRRGQFGVIPGRDSHVWYNVKVVHSWPDDPDHANVMGEGNDNAGSLELVADWVVSGRLRIVAPDSVPPRKVVERIGHDRVRDIRRIELPERTVWIGRPMFADELVLDEKGHLVRSKKVLKAIAEVS